MSGNTVISLNGKSAHAMEPDNGVNAAVLLATFLNRIFQEGHSKDFTQFMFDAFGNETRGRFLGLAFNDEISGDTTLNAGIVTFNPEKGGEIKVSMRYSVTYPFEEKMTTCMKRLTETSFSVDIGSNSHRIMSMRMILLFGRCKKCILIILEKKLSYWQSVEARMHVYLKKELLSVCYFLAGKMSHIRQMNMYI